MNRFWMVYGHGRSAPTYRHPTKDSAQREAKRLAQLNPGSTFTVLKSTKAFRAEYPVVAEIKFTDHDPDFDEVAF